MSRIISFRGLMADGAQERISLETIKGLKGYQITKFEIMPEKPGSTDFEHTVLIYKTEQDAVSAAINFSNNRLLAAAFTEGNNSSNYIGQPLIAIFDNEKFNQDIYITHSDAKGSLNCNYYFELEQSDLSIDEQTVATLKDIRNTGTQ